MVVALLAADSHLHFVVASVARCLEEILWEELALLVKVVARALLPRPGKHPSLPWDDTTPMTHIVDEDVQGLFVCLADELGRVVLILRLLEAALEVVLERLLAPRALGRVRDRRKGGRGAVLLAPAQHGVQVKRQRAVSAHGMSEDRLATEVLRAKRAFTRALIPTDNGGRTIGSPAASTTSGISTVT